MQEIGAFFRTARGVPQGLNASVLLAEVFISVFLRRLTCSLHVEPIAYVDDITIVTRDPATLHAAIGQLREV